MFSLMGLVANYYLNSEMVSAQETSLRVNEEWAMHRGTLADYRRLGRDIFDAANQIFESQNSTAQRAEVNQALAEFAQDARVMRESIVASATPSIGETMLPKIALVEGSMHKMAAMAEEAFRFFDEGNSSQARLRAAAVEAERRILTENINAMASAITAIQQANFERQTGTLEELRARQVLVGIVILFTIGAIIACGVLEARAARDRMSKLERTAKSLRMSEAKLANIFKMAPEGIFAVDETGCISMFSNGAEAMFGYRAEEVIGRDLECLIPERYRAAHRNYFQAFVAAPSASRKMGSGMEVIGLRKDGTEFPMEAALAKVEMPDGVICTAIVRDLTRAKAMYDALQNAKRQAEEASKAKSNFIANMSHELRTPLNAILGFSELLQSETFAAKRVEYSNAIHGSGRHLLDLINDILDLSKVEAGRWSLHETIIDFRLLALECVEVMASNAKAAHINLVSDIPRHLPPISGDKRALKQILLNLVSNAIKYTRAGGDVTVFVRLEKNGELSFGVKDSGVGIAEDDQKFVFDRFGQGRHDTVRADKGTGLGLPIVKGLALAHGGRVALKSQVNVGTCVTVFLPAVRVQPETAQAVA
jgi:PAS domain S-box-containing protein